MSSSLHKSEEKCGKRKGGKRTKMGRLTHPAVINDSYQQDDFKAQMKAAFTQQKPLQHGEAGKPGPWLEFFFASLE